MNDILKAALLITAAHAEKHGIPDPTGQKFSAEELASARAQLDDAERILSEPQWCNVRQTWCRCHDFGRRCDDWDEAARHDDPEYRIMDGESKAAMYRAGRRERP